MVLKSVEQHPAYRAVLEQTLLSVARANGHVSLKDAGFEGGDVGGDVGEFRHGLKNEAGQGIVQEAERKRNSATADSVRGFPMEVL